jgi:CubicO group peptidase (beta-lactamase class C family)
MRPAFALVACGAAAVLLAGCSTAPNVSTMSSVPDGVEQSDAMMAEVLEPDQPGCSAAVGMNGSVVWAGALGLADVDDRRPLSTGSMFDLASVSKQFTAVAVLLLEHEGSLELSDPLSQHLDELPSWADDVTLANLMHHRSGIPDYTAALGVGPDEPTDQADAIKAIAGSTPAFDAGSRFEYSNSNYVLLAEVVQSAAGESLTELLGTSVFTPLDLDMHVDPSFDGPLVTTPYLPQSSGPVASRSSWTQLGDGSVFTTPSELVRWADAFRLDPLGVLDAAVEHAEDTGDGSSYGPGILVHADGTLSHLGGWSGYGAAFTVSADRGTAVAVLCNDGARDPRTVADALATIWALR